MPRGKGMVCAPVGLSFDLRLEHAPSASNLRGDGWWSGSPQGPPTAAGSCGQGTGGNGWRWPNAASASVGGAGVNVASAMSVAMAWLRWE